MRKKCKRKIWATNIDVVGHAIAGAAITDTKSLNKLRLGELSAIDSIVRGEGTVTHWQLLVDCMNIAETMGLNGIGPEVLPHCELAQQALYDAAKRYEKIKRIGLSGVGIQAIKDVIEYHDLQRSSVSRSVYETMIEKTRNKLRSHGKNVTHIT
jgi:hypothetical protein